MGSIFIFVMSCHKCGEYGSWMTVSCVQRKCSSSYRVFCRDALDEGFVIEVVINFIFVMSCHKCGKYGGWMTQSCVQRECRFFMPGLCRNALDEGFVIKTHAGYRAVLDEVAFWKKSISR